MSRETKGKRRKAAKENQKTLKATDQNGTDGNAILPGTLLRDLRMCVIISAALTQVRPESEPCENFEAKCGRV